MLPEQPPYLAAEAKYSCCEDIVAAQAEVCDVVGAKLLDVCSCGVWTVDNHPGADSVI